MVHLQAGAFAYHIMKELHCYVVALGLCITSGISPALAANGGDYRLPNTIAGVVRNKLTQVELAAPQTVCLGLQIRDAERLRERVLRGEVLTPTQLIAEHMPSLAEWQDVANWAESQGLTILQHDPSHMTVFAKGSVSQIQNALNVQFAKVAGVDGNEYTSAVTAAALPANISSKVVSVRGLVPRVKAMSVNPKSIT